MVPDLQQLRLGFKRAFSEYYLALRSPGIADPTESFAACYEYLSVLRDRLGGVEFMNGLDDETIHLAGQIEQDLRRRLRNEGRLRDDGPLRHEDLPLESDPALSDDLEDRLRECFESALARLIPAETPGENKAVAERKPGGRA